MTAPTWLFVQRDRFHWQARQAAGFPALPPCGFDLDLVVYGREDGHPGTIISCPGECLIVQGEDEADAYQRLQRQLDRRYPAPA